MKTNLLFEQCLSKVDPETMKEVQNNMKTTEERFNEFAILAGLNTNTSEYHTAKAFWLQSANEQKAIDDMERKSLIEKVIWLIEDSYPNTDMWTHDELVENVQKDLVRRAKMWDEMFGI